MPHVIDWLAATVVAHAGPLLSVLAATGLLLGSLRLLGRVFDKVDFEQIRERYRRYFSSRWVAFGVGLGLTALTTSIAFSLGVIVPIYNRGYLRHREVIPYMFGANIGTLLDTVVVSLFVEVAGGVASVLLVMGMTALVTLPALVAIERYRRLIDGVLGRLLASRRAFLLFLGSLGLGPLALVGMGWYLAGEGELFTTDRSGRDCNISPLVRGSTDCECSPSFPIIESKLHPLFLNRCTYLHDLDPSQ
jgi:sodium-dependent phosphate cotransporter